MNILLAAIQYTSWPIVTLIGLFLFKAQLGELVSNLRQLKAGSLEASFAETLNQQGFSEAQLKIINTLSPAEIDIFLLASFSDNKEFNYSTGLEATEFKKIMSRLQRAGLLEITNPEDPGTNIRHNTTPIGKSVRAMLLNGTTKLLHTNK